jgi:hypothetical protein
MSKAGSSRRSVGFSVIRWWLAGAGVDLIDARPRARQVLHEAPARRIQRRPLLGRLRRRDAVRARGDVRACDLHVDDLSGRRERGARLRDRFSSRAGTTPSR